MRKHREEDPQGVSSSTVGPATTTWFCFCVTRGVLQLRRSTPEAEGPEGPGSCEPRASVSSGSPVRAEPPMICQSADSPDAARRHERRADGDPTAGDSDENRIASAMKDLRNTGWYWGGLTANEAKELLHEAPEGTFLVRDSSQRDYLFTISAMTSAGPTNLRIEYKEGKFKLDSVVLIRPKLRQFDSVVHLVEHYVQLSRTSSRASAAAATSSRASTATAAGSRAGAGVPNPQPGAGASPSGTVQLLLTTPVYTATPSLQHLCRVSINRSARRVQDLPLPPRLIDYLADYAYHV
ncbi:hypothetical protein CRUP_021334 [Coryphaenoides rupestris]|nr:hypothetical protein CRUP_021334 [Coryphaenoides rupestris]